VDEDDISDAAKVEIARILAAQKADTRTAMSRADAATMTGLSTSTIERLEDSGELVSFLDNRRRLVSTASIYARMIRLVIKANPKKGPKPKRNPFWGVRPDWKRRKALAEKRADGAV
jgi:hypothetical protein